MENETPLKNKSSIGKAVSVAVLIMAVSNIVSRLLGWGRIKVLAHLAGVSSEVDAYIFAFAIPDLINHFLAGSALSITFIPLFQSFIEKNDEKGGWRFFSNVFTVGSVLFVIAITLSMIYTREIFFLAGKNINNPNNPQQLTLTIHLTRIILPAQLFFFWGALLNGVQYARKRFLLPAFTPILYNLGIIFGGVFLYGRFGVAGFSWGVLIGAFLGNVVIQIIGALRVGMRFKPCIDLSDKNMRTFFLITIPLIVGLSMTFSNEFLPKYFASFVPDGEGAISNLDYSYKIVSMLFGFFGQSVVAGVYPFLSQLAVQKKMEEMHKLLTEILVKISSLLIPIVGISIVLASNIIAILLEGGSFGSENTAMVARTFSFFIPCAFFMAGALIYIRAYYALKRTFFPMVISTVAIVICLPFYYYSAINIGSYGIAGAATFAMALLFIMILFFWNKHYINEHIIQIIRSLSIITLISGIGVFGCFGIKKLIFFLPQFATVSLTNHILICLICGIPAFICILLGLEFAGVQNMRTLLKTIVKR